MNPKLETINKSSNVKIPAYRQAGKYQMNVKKLNAKTFFFLILSFDF
jgi:hypothetical protein